jgi:preprotein translocase subunit YajC
MLSTFLSHFAAIFAQDAQQSPTGGLTNMIIMIGIALAFFYFILYRPEQKRRKRAEQMRSSIKKGDKVTAMGIVGVINKVKDQTVIIKTGEDSKIEMLKGAITDITSSGEEKGSEPISTET